MKELTARQKYFRKVYEKKLSSMDLEISKAIETVNSLKGLKKYFQNRYNSNKITLWDF